MASVKSVVASIEIVVVLVVEEAVERDIAPLLACRYSHRYVCDIPGRLSPKRIPTSHLCRSMQHIVPPTTGTDFVFVSFLLLPFLPISRDLWIRDDFAPNRTGSRPSKANRIDRVVDEDQPGKQEQQQAGAGVVVATMACDDDSLTSLSFTPKDETVDGQENLFKHLRLSELNFNVVWKAMQKRKWKFTGSLYNPPSLDIVVAQDKVGGATASATDDPAVYTAKSSLDTCRYLDRFGVVPIDNLLQLPPDALLGLSANQIEVGQRLRRTLTDELYHILPKQRYTVMKPNQELYRIDAEEKDHQSSPRRSARVRSNEQSHRKQNASVMVADEGANQLLSGRRKQPKRKRSNNNSNGIPGLGGTKEAKMDDQSIKLNQLSLPEKVASHFANHRSDSVERIEAKLSQQFQDWLFLLSTRHSLLCYGVGSKRRLLHRFSTETLENAGDVLEIDGFDRDVTIEDMLDLVEEQFLGHSHPSDSTNRKPSAASSSSSSSFQDVAAPVSSASHAVVRRAASLSKAVAQEQLTKAQRPLFIVLHNIDGLGFRNRTVQEALSALVINSGVCGNQSFAIRLVSSVDHVSASALLWDVQTAANFRWVWKQTDTYRLYTEEIARGLDVFRRRSVKSKTGQAIIREECFADVLSTLAPRHTEVLQIIANFQKDMPGDVVPYKQVLQKALEKCAVTGDTPLRNLLTELIDHGLVEKGRDRQKEWLQVPYSEEKLDEILTFRIRAN